jgi:hypothetical protein
MWNTLSNLLIVTILFCSCAGKCHYHDIIVTAKIGNAVYVIGDTLTVALSLQCKKGKQIALHDKPLDNLYIVTAIGEKLLNEDHGVQADKKISFTYVPTPAQVILQAVIENQAGKTMLRFIPSNKTLNVNIGTNRFTFYYCPPKASLDWTDSDEGWPCTEVELLIREVTGTLSE